MGEARPSANHSSQVRARARRIWLRSLTQRQGFRSSARLGLIAVYSIVFMWGGYFDWAGWTETILWSVGAVLWVVIAVLFVRELIRSKGRLRHVGVHPSLPLLLIAPVFLWTVWWPPAAFILVVVAYILELRHHSAGDGFLFSFGLVLFIGVFAGLSMVEVEGGTPQSTLRTPSDAIFWAFASLLRINYGKALTPQTDDGRILATVVGLCAILGASLFTAQLVSWVVGSEKRQEAEAAAAEASAALDETAADPAAESGGGDASDSSADGPAPDRDDVVIAELAAIRAELAALRAHVESSVGRLDAGPASASGGTLPS